jgi:hypothetical protein
MTDEQPQDQREVESVDERQDADHVENDETAEESQPSVAGTAAKGAAAGAALGAVAGAAQHYIASRGGDEEEEEEPSE